MALNVETLAAAMGYTKATVEGAGAIKGKNCVISSISPITGGHRITFQWTLDDGTVQTGTMDVADGTDGLGVQSVDINGFGHFIVTYTNGTTHDAGAVTSYKLVTAPTITGNSFTYDGTAQGPQIDWAEGMEDYCTVEVATATNAGTYTLRVSLKNVHQTMWRDGTTEDITFDYTIAKATPTVTISPSSVTLDSTTQSATLAVSTTSDGSAFSLSSSDDTVATVSPSSMNASGNVTVAATQKNGTVTITATVAATDNCNSASATCIVTCSFLVLKTFSAATDEELVAMVEAADRGEIDLYEDAGWRVGQEREVSISAINTSGTYDGVTWRVYNPQSAQTIKVILIHKGDYELVTPVKAKGGADRNTCSFVVGIRDCLSARDFINHSSEPSTDSWQGTDIRNWCNGGFRGSLPDSIRGIFKLFKCKSWNKPLNVIETTQDYFALAAEKEVYGRPAVGNTTEADNLVQFSWYDYSGHRAKDLGSEGTMVSWWLRSRAVSEDPLFVSAESNTDSPGVGGATTYCIGLSPFGCI